MPDSNGKPNESELEAEDSPEDNSSDLQILPKVIPPKTAAPFQFNQQINIQEIPSKVWDRLSPEQVVDLTKSMLDRIESMDARHFDFAMDQAERGDNQGKRNTYVSAGVALAGYSLTAFLASTGETLIAAVVATSSL